jgi:DNA-binding transcriptional MerR regulator
MDVGQSFTLSDLARALDTPQHRLIHLCEKGVVTPDLQGAHGRGSSRLFSPRNLLEFAIALRLRSALLPVATVGAVLEVLRAFEGKMRRELPGFSLPETLRDEGAPDLRIILSDGLTIYFSLAEAGLRPRLFGGIALDQSLGTKTLSIKGGEPAPTRPNGQPTDSDGFGGPEGSQFVRLELSVTQVARDLPLV